jgi:decaprenylphospho-beta-D-ribofuranose 2-oxidase
LYCGRWAEAAEAPPHYPKPKFTVTAPFPMPSGILNRTTIGVFNMAVYGSHFRRHKRDVVDADTFLYPRDRINHWNILYGPRGVTQHQSVIPDEAGPEGIRGLLDVLNRSGAASFVTVIKACGEEGEGLLSFPRPGMSVALDIPIRANTQEVIDRLNEHVLACGGRIYLTKDGFTRALHFRRMEPRLPAFLAEKKRWDPQGRLQSAQSRRLFGEST